MTRAALFRGVAAAAILGALAVVTAGVAAATEVKCRLSDKVRRIEVVHDPDPGLLCEVRYDKSDQAGSGTVLWIGKHDRTFCHDRADRLIAKLADMGWVCDVMRKRTEVGGAADGAGPGIAVPRPQR